MRAFLTSTFLRWTLAAGALSFAFAALFSIGVFVLPFAIALLVWAALAEQRPVPTAGGIACGIGVTVALVGGLNADTSWGRTMLLAGLAVIVAALAAGRWACGRGAPA